jgi:hypothetical protein
MTTPDASELLPRFHEKYVEFAKDLIKTFPELSTEINAAIELPEEERVANYTKDVLTTASVKADQTKTPGKVLPGVEISPELWATAGKKTRAAIYEYISLLNLCMAFQGSGEFTKEWADNMMRDARASMNKLDFDSISKLIFKTFGSKEGSTDALPPLPERFLKGKLAKLAEEMVKEFKPTDFGITKEQLEACERDPTRAFEILMSASMMDPNTIKSAMMRVGKRLQEKVARGEFKPAELVAEAEELMKEFQEHPAFVELMETFRNAFNFSDMETARATGHDNEGRLSKVRERLRKKLEQRKKK